MALLIPLLAHPMVTFIDVFRPVLEVAGFSFLF
ncbi:MAG: hypothetical protein VE98_C0001G0460 [candidate division Kazan bacterium GW2011_GWA1_50_15]|uniref:Uncharacterized protein n=1 Tax=candidate division Kazan bacterium GW2011_GWA1_50_15 TaxID=1620412 RepID=A0A0G4BAK3_UNCK3|nr:MAG: hypothetical protein VE98_C0001G0460 [candidate division Kazan bacterium GW2011_GWA1_50_15]